MDQAMSKSLASSGVLYTDRRDFYIKPNIVKELWTDVAPFLTVVANQGTISGMADPTFKMFEHKNPWQKQCFSINDELTVDGNGDPVTGEDHVLEAGNSGSAEYFAIDGVKGIVAGKNLIGLQIEIWNEAETAKSGVALITDYNGSGVQLKNLHNGAITIADNDKCYIVGSAMAEGSLSPEAWADDLSVVYNSTQIFKTPVQITGTLLQASLRGESKELARLRDQKSSEHKIQKERAFLFGSNPKGISGDFGNIEAIVDANGMAIRSTMGIVPALQQHGNDGTGSGGKDPYEQNVFGSDDLADYDAFVDMMEKVFQYVPTAGMKRAFVGAGALGYFSKQGAGSNSAGWAKEGGWGVDLSDMKRDTLGFNYRTLETPHGVLQLIPTPALRGPYNKHMLVVSDENLFHAQYREPKFEASIQPNDADFVKDQYFSDEGIGVSQIESHALMVTP